MFHSHRIVKHVSTLEALRGRRTQDDVLHSPAVPSPSRAIGGGHQPWPSSLLNPLNFAPAPGKGNFWPPAQPAGTTMSHLHVTAPGGSHSGEGPAVPPAHITGGTSPHAGSPHVEEDSAADCFKLISKRLAAPPWGVYFQTLSTFIQPDFHCFALGFLQLQAMSDPLARASSLIPWHADDARGGNESCGLSCTWFS